MKPGENVIERHWDILDIINQKESRPQDKPKPFSELPKEEQENILKWYPELQELKRLGINHRDFQLLEITKARISNDWKLYSKGDLNR